MPRWGRARRRFTMSGSRVFWGSEWGSNLWPLQPFSLRWSAMPPGVQTCHSKQSISCAPVTRTRTEASTRFRQFPCSGKNGVVPEIQRVADVVAMFDCVGMHRTWHCPITPAPWLFRTVVALFTCYS